MILQILLLTLGLALLVKGADWLVEGASDFARKKKVSDLAIGLTIVAFGTSAPELVVNVFASWQGHQDIVFGNVIGSNYFNLFAILGITGLISPMLVQSSTVWKEIPLSFLAAVILFFLANDFTSSGEEVLSRGEGLLLLILFAAFLYYVYRQMKRSKEDIHRPLSQLSGAKTALLLITGLAGLVIGGRLVVSSAMDMASSLGVSEKIIGLTIVAAGTSLPELATSVVAALKKNNDIAVGNIVGSNIFNIFFILAVSAIVRPVAYDSIFNYDLYFLLGGTLFLFITMFSGARKKIDRWEAMILLVAFIIYTVYLILRES